jgi:hypothetical protein
MITKIKKNQANNSKPAIAQLVERRTVEFLNT